MYPDLGLSRTPMSALLGVQLLEPLGQHLLELVDRTPLQEHVPVRADVLGLLRLGLTGIPQKSRRTAAAAVPGGRDLGLAGQRHPEGVPMRAVVDGFPARGQVRVAVSLVAGRAEAAAPKDSLTHVASWLRVFLGTNRCSTRGIPMLFAACTLLDA